MEFALTLEDLVTIGTLSGMIITGLTFVFRHFYKQFIGQLDSTRAALCKDIQDTKAEVAKVDRKVDVQSTTLANHLLDSKGSQATLEFIEKLVLAGTPGAPFKGSALPPGQQKLR